MPLGLLIALVDGKAFVVVATNLCFVISPTLTVLCVYGWMLGLNVCARGRECVLVNEPASNRRICHPTMTMFGNTIIGFEFNTIVVVFYSVV